MWHKWTRAGKIRMIIFGVTIAALLGIGAAAFEMLNEPISPGAATLTDGSYFIRPGHAASFDDLGITIRVEAVTESATLRVMCGEEPIAAHSARAGDALDVCGYVLSVLETDPQKGIRFTLNREG